MPPHYFHRRLTFAEAADYIEGLSMRYRPGWEQARLVADVDARCNGNREGVGIEFPWEADTEAHRPPTEEDLAQLREHQKIINEKLNQATAL